MRTIHKFPIQISGGDFIIPLSGECQVLDVQVQQGVPMMWVELDPDAEKMPTTFAVFPTGGEIDDEWVHLATFQMHGGELVWHLYWRSMS